MLNCCFFLLYEIFKYYLIIIKIIIFYLKMEITYRMSFTIGCISLIIIYIFDWFQFRSNLNFLLDKIFRCCCPCCCKKKEFEVIKEEGDGKNFSEIILEKFGLLIRTHPYGKSGVQGLEKLKFVKINKQRYPDLYNLYNNYNNINLYQYQMLFNENEKKDEKLVNQIFEYEGNNKFKDITNQYPEIPSEGVDKSILFKSTL